ncbi:unnamed protein product [Pseudo-nitzschia multistriata]|uniref:Uncharacterized protein n=1 Tax=Pseudo-nitzschia multistriata TaxID=183589 RepID=A0A448Z0S5_9STRA|nr:unnamed protein product [Pseudo-nitzschia multistriata]
MRSTSRIFYITVAVICLVTTTVDGFAALRPGVTSTTKITSQLKSESSTTANNLAIVRQTQLFAGSNAGVVPGIGEEGCNLPSVSGINTKDDLTQAFVVKVVFLSLALGTFLFSSGLEQCSGFLDSNFPSQYEFFRNTWPISFGLIFSLAGVTHFTLKEEYENIYPTRGAWGVWYLPGSRAFHVAWTGAAELAGGLGLLAAGVSSFAGNPNLAPLTSAGLESDSAAALFLLVLAVTPANIFMFTHGAKLPMDSEPLPVSFHGVRWIMQVVLLGFLYQMGQETFQALLS